MDYKIIFHEHGQCHPDYFQGTPGVQINLDIHNKMTKKEVLEMLQLEINFNCDHIGYTLFEANDRLIPDNMDQTINELLETLASQNDLDKIYDSRAPNVKEFLNNEEVAPFIFSLTVEFLD
jgi:hypothetical protein